MEVFIMANGGYTILDFKDKDFTIGTHQKIEGVYSQIENNYSKPIILWGLTINGSAKKALFLNFDKKEGTYTTTEGNYIYTISSDDNVLIEEVKDITLDDLMPVIDCGGRTFGQYAGVTIAGSFDKCKNGGPVKFKNFKFNDIVTTGTTDKIADEIIVNFYIVPDTTNVYKRAQGTIVLVYRSGNSPSYTLKADYVNCSVDSTNKVEFYGTTVKL